MKVQVKLVFDDWRDRQDMTKSVYNTRTGVELSLGSFHHGSSFLGEIEVTGEEAKFLQGVMKDGWLPTFVLTDPNTKSWRWK